jgi:hypothetical protein
MKKLGLESRSLGQDSKPALDPLVLVLATEDQSDLKMRLRGQYAVKQKFLLCAI